MKQMIMVLSILLLSIGLFGCQQNNKVKVDNTPSNTENLEKVTLYPMETNSEEVVISDRETIKTIIEAVDSAEKLSGIVNMANPEFKIKIGEKEYFLWIDEKSGTIMNTEDTHTIYSISESLIDQVNELLNKRGR
jgi:hypothetical protein